MPDEDEARGLLALLLFQQARRATRFDADGDLVPMEEQDRGRWDRAAIDEGRWQLRRAASSGRPAGPVPAAGRHRRPARRRRDRGRHRLGRRSSPHYDALLTAQPSPVVALNRAIAIGFRDGPEAGLAELDRVGAAPELDGYYLLPAARADFLRRPAGPTTPPRPTTAALRAGPHRARPALPAAPAGTAARLEAGGCDRRTRCAATCARCRPQVAQPEQR